MIKKGMLALQVMCVSSAAFAGSLTAKDLQGYVVGQLAIQGPNLVVELQINSNGTYSYRQGTVDSVSPKGACTGEYKIQNDVFTGDLICKMGGDQQRITQEIDLKGITLQALKKGVTVEVRSSVMGGQPLPFTVKKLDKAYFPN